MSSEILSYSIFSQKKKKEGGGIHHREIARYNRIDTSKENELINFFQHGCSVTQHRFTQLSNNFKLTKTCYFTNPSFLRPIHLTINDFLFLLILLNKFNNMVSAATFYLVPLSWSETTKKSGVGGTIQKSKYLTRKQFPSMGVNFVAKKLRKKNECMNK